LRVRVVVWLKGTNISAFWPKVIGRVDTLPKVVASSQVENTSSIYMW